MTTQNDGTPLTEDIGEIAANEGVAAAGDPPKRKRGRPKGSGTKNRDRSEEYARRYAKEKAAKDPGAKSAGSAPKPDAFEEPPFTAGELREVMIGVGGALFALPGEALAKRRPDLAESLRLGEQQTLTGGKAVAYYVSTRFPDLFEKWGPEMMLLGTALLAYVPRILLMAGTPVPVNPEASIDGKPAPIRAVPGSGG